MRRKIRSSGRFSAEHLIGKGSARSTAFGYAPTSYLPINNLRCSPKSIKAMRFGDLPEWATELSNSVREAVFFSDCLSESTNAAKGGKACLFPSELLWREPLFDQLIVNTYLPGEGICAHVDLMRFQDGIAIVSLESACVMHFSRVEDELSDDNRTAEDPGESTSTAKIPVLLSEGSLVLMWGEARYLWKHEINRKPGFQKWRGQDIIDQRKRTSITLRKLC